MKIASLSFTGIGVVVATPVNAIKPGYDDFYCIRHGGSGSGQWEIRIPLNSKQFPMDPTHRKVELLSDDYHLVVLDHKKDPRGNSQCVIARAETDNKYLILWDLSPGVGSTAFWRVEGDAEVIAKGVQTTQEGNAQSGKVDCPIVLVNGPCTLTWYREGYLHGHPRAWEASYDGAHWIIAPSNKDWSDVHSEFLSVDVEDEEPF